MLREAIPYRRPPPPSPHGSPDINLIFAVGGVDIARQSLQGTRGPNGQLISKCLPTQLALMRNWLNSC
jgi:hypothetical protein